jgi:multidrug efflux system membrane fusion protein
MRLAVLLLGAACSRAPGPNDAPAAAVGAVETSIPVQTVAVVRAEIPIIVTAPGRTDSLEKLEIRAPFDGILLDLNVTDGDQVKTDQVIGWVVSRDSQAALAGANAMLRAAETEQERRDAERALVLAKRSIVRTPLRTPEAGIVFSHQVDEGARVALNEQIVVIVASDSIVFLAQIAQVELGRVRAGNRAEIELVAIPNAPMAGTVRSILPGGSASDLTAPVRIDFMGKLPRELNLYGNARITVDVHHGALVVPSKAVVRDDVSGVSRIAVVDATQHAHWINVTVGLSYGDRVELVSPPLQEGARVVVTGQVGLPDGARVQESNASS